MSSPRTQRLALGLALAAFVTVAIALIYVATRGSGQAGKPAAEAKPTLVERKVAAADVAQLQQQQVNPDGLVVADSALAGRLGLALTDRLVEISGRPLRDHFGMIEAMSIARINDVTRLYIVIAAPSGERTERWTLDRPLGLPSMADVNGSGLPTLRVPTPTPPPAPPIDLFAPDPDDTRALLDSITRTDDTHVTIPRSTVDKVLANPMAVANGARIVPAVTNGAPSGFKIYAVRPNSIYARIGLQNGDRITAVNGFPLTTLDKALEIYTKLRDATALDVEIARRGTPLTLSIKIQ